MANVVVQQTGPRVPWAQRTSLQALLLGAAAAIAAALCYLAGPPGGDAATHLYQTELFRQHGFVLWDNLWYAGRYSFVNYSLLYYPAVVLTAPVVVIAGAVGASTMAAVLLIQRQWPNIGPLPGICIALSLPLEVIAGVYPFLLGMAFSLWMLVAVQSGALRWASLLAVLAIATHTLAFGMAVIVLASWALTDRTWIASTRYRIFAAVLIILAIIQLVLLRLFSLPGTHYIFDPKDLIAILVICGVGGVLSAQRPELRGLRMVFIIYGLLSVIDYAIPNAVGGNAVRFAVTFGIVLIIIPLCIRRFRPAWVAVVCLVIVAVWQAIPPINEWRYSTSSQGQSAAYWTPALRFLDGHSDPNFRVEVVQSKRYWEAYYIARDHHAMARGWYRQDDFPANSLLYGNLTPASYRTWLRSLGVNYVLLSTDQLDFTSIQEAQLLRSGRSGLQMVAHDGAWTIYALAHPTPIVTPTQNATLVGGSGTQLQIAVLHPGWIDIRVHDTPYWSADAPTAQACLRPAPNGMTALYSDRPGMVTLSFELTAQHMIDALLGRSPACAISPPATGAIPTADRPG